MTAPTDAEVEAMAERLWEVNGRTRWGDDAVLSPWAVMVDWEKKFIGKHTGELAAFRAMARVALVKLTDENGDEVRG